MKTLLLVISILTAILTAASPVFAQQGTLSGTVKDKASGEPIIGATIYITGSSKGAVTDATGNYALQLEAGIYKLNVSYVSYKPQVIDNVRIDENKTTSLDITIEENTNALQSVSIIGTRQTNTDITLLKALKQSELVTSGISGEQITKSLDRDAAETVRRIPGVTIMNDKYIVIRGMAERYNTVMLNDAFTPSTEPDMKSFSFDLLPTSVIDRIMIYKAGSPELPGDFGGGVIKVYTKNVATENSTTLGVSTSYRGNTSLGNFYSYAGSKTDFLGFDNGTRQLPGVFPKNLNKISSGEQLSQIGRSLNNTWQAEQNTAMPDLRLSLGISRIFNIKDIQVSNITSLSYSNTRLHTSGRRTKYDEYIPSLKASPINYDYTDEISSLNARLGAVHNWSFRFNDNNKIEFRNLFNQLGSSQVLNRSGVEAFTGLDQRNYSLRYESRTMYSNQLQGTHNLNEKTSVTWTGGYAYTNRDEPDYRRVRTQRNQGTEDPFRVSYKYTPSLGDAGRFYSKLNENSFALNGQIEHKFNPADSLSENAPKIRAGFYAEIKNRDFNARFFSYRPADPAQFNKNLELQPLDQVFSDQNINNQTGWEVIEGTSVRDAYFAHNTYFAGFLGGSLPITPRFSAAGGARLEHNIQELILPNVPSRHLDVKKPLTFLLPSLNLTYNLNDRALLRFGSSISLNRPEFRELAPFTYFDFENQWEITGNTRLKTATIYNTDLRYEFYPNPTELISFGVFNKYFRNSIERFFPGTSIGNSIEYLNSDNAFNYGVETEIRKSLVDVSGSRFIQNLSVVLNASLIKSKVITTDPYSGERSVRALTGQSPYIVNTGLYYQDGEKNLQFNLLYNVIGPRIYVIGSIQNPTVYEMPRHVIDLSFTKGIGQRLELKAGIQDLLNQQWRLVQDSDRNEKINGADESIRKLKRGTYSTISLSYKL